MSISSYSPCGSFAFLAVCAHIVRHPDLVQAALHIGTVFSWHRVICYNFHQRPLLSRTCVAKIKRHAC